VIVKIQSSTLLICLTLCSCDLSSPISSPEPQKIEADRKPNEHLEKATEKFLATEIRQSTPRNQDGQDSTKSFDDLQSPVTKGKPKLPFPSGNLLE
tara:strand:- start:536 stop:823 length:288 start_codon:yes stop_codon:yes gene_type:complete